MEEAEHATKRGVRRTLEGVKDAAISAGSALRWGSSKAECGWRMGVVHGEGGGAEEWWGGLNLGEGEGAGKRALQQKHGRACGMWRYREDRRGGRPTGTVHSGSL